MKVLVCGGRNWRHYEEFCRFIKWAEKEEGFFTECVVCGGATGADRLAAKWALENNIPLRTYPAEWEKFGKKAGPLRNARMLEDQRPEIVFAFPGGKGTANMIEQAKQAGVHVIRYEDLDR